MNGCCPGTLDGDPERGVAEVRVEIRRAGLVDVAGLRQTVEDDLLPRGDRADRVIRAVRLPRQPRVHRRHLEQRDRRRAHRKVLYVFHFRHVPFDGIGEAHPALLHQLQHRQRRELLGDRSDSIVRVVVGPTLRFRVSVAVVLRPQQLVAGDDADGKAADSIFREVGAMDLSMAEMAESSPFRCPRTRGDGCVDLSVPSPAAQRRTGPECSSPRFADRRAARRPTTIPPRRSR